MHERAFDAEEGSQIRPSSRAAGKLANAELELVCGGVEAKLEVVCAERAVVCGVEQVIEQVV